VARCVRCKALLASWREVKEDLRVLRKTTHLESAPARVEMRLKQELRTRREARVPRRTVVIASWALAAAAALAAAVGWIHWRESGGQAKQIPAIAQTSPEQISPETVSIDSAALIADYDTGEFTQLPGRMPTASSDDSVLQARVQRGTLMQFGLPVAPEQASD